MKATRTKGLARITGVIQSDVTGNVHQRLEPGLAGDLDGFPRPHLDQLRPVFHQRRQVVDHHGDQRQAEEPFDDVTIGLVQAFGLRAAAEGEPKCEADRKEELRHDRVGIATEVIAVLENERRGSVAADEVDQEHAGPRCSRGTGRAKQCESRLVLAVDMRGRGAGRLGGGANGFLPQSAAGAYCPMRGISRQLRGSGTKKRSPSSNDYRQRRKSESFQHNSIESMPTSSPTAYPASRQ